MMKTILAHYETGTGLEPINLFTVLYMLRKHQNATVRLLCDHHAGFVQAQDKDEKDQVRRAIANQIARAERNLLVEKDPDSPNRKSSYRLTDRGNLQIQAGLQMRAAYLRNNPRATPAMACANASRETTLVNTAEVQRAKQKKASAASKASAPCIPMLHSLWGAPVSDSGAERQGASA